MKLLSMLKTVSLITFLFQDWVKKVQKNSIYLKWKSFVTLNKHFCS